MKNDRTGGKRTNWLLIKHRDEFSREGNGDAILAEDNSVASGRTMAAITAGKGRGPKPFMLAEQGASRARCGLGQQPGQRRRRTQAGKIARVCTEEDARTGRRAIRRSSFPISSRRSFASPSSVRRRGGWGHEIKFDGYRVQLRVAGGKATLKTRKGLDWTDKFTAIAREAAVLPDCIIDGEIVALDSNGAPDFAALQAALSEQETDNLIFFAFDLLLTGDADLRSKPLVERKAELQTLLDARGVGKDTLIRFVEHFETGGDAVLRSACRLSLEGIVSKRLDAPYRSGRTKSWTKAKCRAGHEVVIGGWTTTDGKFRSLLVGVHRGDHSSMSAASERATAKPR